jgi:hypothetical protein
MSLDKIVLLIFLSAIVLFAQAVFAAQEPKGNFDYAGCDVFSGWSCDADSYSTALSIHFYADGLAGGGTFVGSTTANLARESAVGSQCGGNVNHGFSFPVPASLMDGKPHTIYAYAINTPSGNNPLLTRNGKSITCAPSSCASGDCFAAGRFYKSQTHTHSNAAGPHAEDPPSVLASKYMNNSYGVISMTDSNPLFPPWSSSPSILRNPTPCSSYDVPGSFMCLPGEESTIVDNGVGYHTTQVGITTGSTGFTYFSSYSPTYQNLLTHAVTQGGFSVIAHPGSEYTLAKLTALQDYSALEINAGLNGPADNWVTTGLQTTRTEAGSTGVGSSSICLNSRSRLISTR